MKTITIDEINYNIPDDVLAKYRAVDDLKPFAEMPEYGESYFCEYENGEAGIDCWNADPSDIARFNSGNCYPTEAGAEAHGGYKRAVARRRLELEYERYVAEHGEIKDRGYCVPYLKNTEWDYTGGSSTAIIGHAFLRRRTADHAVELGEKFGEEIKTLWS